MPLWVSQVSLPNAGFKRPLYDPLGLKDPRLDVPSLGGIYKKAPRRHIAHEDFRPNHREIMHFSGSLNNSKGKAASFSLEAYRILNITAGVASHLTKLGKQQLN